MSKRTIRLLLVAGALHGASGPAHAASGEGTGAFVLRGGSARSAVLGESYGAIGGDADALLWNPAALASIRETHVQATYQDVFGLGLARHTTLSFAMSPRREDLITRGDSIIVVPSDAPGPVFAFSMGALVVDLDEESYWELTPTVGLAHRVGPGTALGVAARYLRASSTIAGVSATGYALDVGVHQSLPLDLSAGIAFRNLVGRVKWKEGREEQEPREVVVSAMRPIGSRVVLLGGLATDLDEDLTDRWNAAAEIVAVPELWTLLLGVDTRRDADEMRSRLSAGTRFRVGELRLDYAFTAEGDTPGETHRVTLLVRL